MTNGRKVLVVDVGGTHIKLLATGQTEAREITSGPRMIAADMVRKVKETTKDWDYEVISIGYPGPLIHSRPLQDPHNLGPGWVKFDFHKAFRRPVKIINDAAMQALGSYRGGRMLFLGLGTGLGSAMIVDGVLVPIELAHLLYRNGKTYEDYLGLRGLKRLGRKKWEKHATIKKYLGPTFEDQFKKGNATSYGMDEQFVLTSPGSMRCTVVTFPDAEAMNKWADAIAATLDKMSQDDRKGWQDALASTTVPNSRRDMLARITHSAHK